MPNNNNDKILKGTGSALTQNGMPNAVLLLSHIADAERRGIIPQLPDEWWAKVHRMYPDL